MKKESIRRLLVIDDNESIHRDFDKILGASASSSVLKELEELDAELFGNDDGRKNNFENEFEISHASQGKQGVEILRRAVQNNEPLFGAAFVDMRMPPGWDGVETIEKLWQSDPNLQVVICTAFSDHRWDEITSRLGGSDRLLILKKPFDEIEVVQLATTLCEKRRLLEERLVRIEVLEKTVAAQAAQLQAFQEKRCRV